MHDTVERRELRPPEEEDLAAERAANFVRLKEQLHRTQERLNEKRAKIAKSREVVSSARSDHVCGGCLGVVLGLGIGLSLASVIHNFTEL